MVLEKTWDSWSGTLKNAAGWGGRRQRERPGPCDIVKPEWPAQMETSDVVEDEAVETRVDRTGGEGVPVDKGCHTAGWVGNWVAQA